MPTIIEMAILLVRCALNEEMVNLAKALYGLGSFLNLVAAGDRDRWLEALHATRAEWRLRGVSTESVVEALASTPAQEAVPQLDAGMASLSGDERERMRLLEAAAYYIHLAGPYRQVGRALLMVYAAGVLTYGYGSVGAEQLDLYCRLVRGRLSTKTHVFVSADLVLLSYGIERLAGAATEVTHR